MTGKKWTNIAKLFTEKKVDKRHLFLNYSLEKLEKCRHFQKTCTGKKQKYFAILNRSPTKQHTILADVLPNNSEELFRKGEFLRTYRVGPLGFSGSLSLVLLLCILTPLRTVPVIQWVVWWWVVWCVLPWKIFRCLKMVFFAQFFFKQVQLIGGTIFFLAPTRQYKSLKIKN